MTYEQTIEWLYQHLPMFSRIGVAAYKKDLHNTIELCKALNDPHKKFKSIHVAGTNGKGSTSHMLAAILQEAGYKTGLYTSPHIKDFGERIRVNGKMISRQFVVDFVKKNMEITVEINPSFFELTVAMAFDYFAQEEVDIAVIETGLGGRLDSTNIISPVLSVITNIGYDHMNMLGNTLAGIAFEKAGIIKQHTPVVIGEVLPETLAVFEKKASEMNAAIYFAQNKYQVEGIYPDHELLRVNILNKETTEVSVWETALRGEYQSKNICTVLSAVDILNKNNFTLPVQVIRSGLMQVKKITGLYGRWDILQTDPAIILDVAHNEDGISQVLQQLKTGYPGAHLHFILGFVNDKDLTKILPLFPKDANYYFSNAHIPRALPYDTLQQLAAQYELHGDGFDDVNDAVNTALKKADRHDVLMVCGSFFIIAEVDQSLLIK